MTRFACLVLVLALGARAHAQESDQAARAHFELGVRLVEQARWSDAVRELEAARAIRATAPVLYNLGIAYRAIGRVRDGIATFQQFIEVLGARGSAARRDEVQGYIAELQTRIAHLSVSVAPEEAQVLVDGRAIESAELDLDPGVHRVRARAPGHEAFEEEITLGDGERRTLEISLTQMRARLHVETATPNAIVTLDGRALGAPPIDTELDPGEHVVEVGAPGYSSLRRTVNLSAGEATRWQPELTATGGDPILTSPWLWIALGVVLAGTGLGLGFGLGSGTEEPYVGDLGLVTGVLRGR